MAKRKSLNRLSKRYSKQRSVGSIGLGDLNPDTNDINEGSTFWWNNLPRNTLSSHSLMHDNKNETSRQLNSMSLSNSIHDNSKWWQNLNNFPNDEQNASTSLGRNISAAIVEENIFEHVEETSTSESEKGPGLKKRRIPLRTTSKKSDSNIFSNVLDDVKGIPIKWRMKQAEHSILHSSLDRDAAQKELDGNEENNLNLSSTANILKKKPNIFRKRKSGEMKNKNVFQEALAAINDVDLFNNANKEQSSHSLTKQLSKLETSTSESEKEFHLKKRKIPLRTTSKKSDNNAFLNVLDDTKLNVPIKLRMKQAKHSALHTNLDKETSQDELHENGENNSFNLSLTPNILKLKPNVFKERNSGEMESENAFQEALEITSNVDLSDDSKEQSSYILTKRLSSLSPKEIRSMRNSLGNQSDTLRHVNKENKSEITNNDLYDDANRTYDSNISKQSSKSSPGKDIRLTRNNSKNRSETSKFANKQASEIINDDDLYDDTNRKYDSSISKQSSKSNPGKDIRLTRNSSRNLSETPRVASKQASEIINDDANRKHDFNIFEQSSKSSPGKNTRLMRSSSRNRSETPKFANKQASEIINDDDLYDDTNRKYDSSISKQSSKSSPGKDIRLTRNSSRNLSETPRVASKQASEIINDDANRKHDFNIFEQSSKSSPGKNTRLMRSSSRNRSETPNFANKQASEIINDADLYDDTNRKYDSSISKQSFKSNSGKDIRLTRNSLRNRSKTSRLTNKETSKFMNSANLSDNANRKQDRSAHVLTSSKNLFETPKIMSYKIHEVTEDDNMHKDVNSKQEASTLNDQLFKSSSFKETRLSRSGLRNQLEISTSKRAPEVTNDNDLPDDTNDDEDNSDVLSKLSSDKQNHLKPNSLRNRSKFVNNNTELPKRSVDKNSDIEESDISVGTEIEIANISQIISSTRILNKTSKDITVDGNVISSVEICDSNDVPATQTVQRNSSSSKNKTNYKTVVRHISPILQKSTRASIEENKEISRQKSLSEFQNQKSPLKTLSKDINKINSSKTSKISDFFKVKRPTIADKRSTSNVRNFVLSQVNAEKMERIKAELEKIKNREMAAMKMNVVTAKEEPTLKSIGTAFKRATKKKKLLANPIKVMDKAFFVNGKVYKAPRLPRPKHWVTDHLYKFLWKHMEPTYKLTTRVQSERFVQELAKMVSLIQRRKKYENYRNELKALMQEMARLKIIDTRNDFYHFCRDFLPYEFYIKVVPMLLPGNKKTIPYDPEKLHIPLLDTFNED